MISQQWYKEIWTLDIKNESWVEDTSNQVDFIIKTLNLKGGERVLDLACGFGRHSLLLSNLGFNVVGVDITKEYIEDAKSEATRKGLTATFICEDIRNLEFEDKFDVVLNLADGAIGYFENDEENLKVFDTISRALKKEGKSFIDICNAEHAELFFPKKHWEIGSKSLSLPEFFWDKTTRRMLYSQWEAAFGQILEKPKEIIPISTTRLYSKDELKEIFNDRGMQVIETYSNYYGAPDSPKELQLIIYSKKKR